MAANHFVFVCIQDTISNSDQHFNYGFPSAIDIRHVPACTYASNVTNFPFLCVCCIGSFVRSLAEYRSTLFGYIRAQTHIQTFHSINSVNRRFFRLSVSKQLTLAWLTGHSQFLAIVFTPNIVHTIPITGDYFQNDTLRHGGNQCTNSKMGLMCSSLFRSCSFHWQTKTIDRLSLFTCICAANDVVRVTCALSSPFFFIMDMTMLVTRLA